VAARDRQDTELQGSASTSTTGDEEKWRRVQKLDVLLRIRAFWWRVLLGILPDYATLTKRHVRVQSTCSVCKSAPATLVHALLECSHARQFWSAAKDVFHLKLPLLHPDTWAEDILCDAVFAKWECGIIISIMAAIWDSQNKWAHMMIMVICHPNLWK
jgi:hypothetical protein